MNKLELALAIAADIGVNKTFACRALIAIQRQLDAQGFEGLVVWLICLVLQAVQVFGSSAIEVFLVSKYTAAVHILCELPLYLVVA